MVSVAEGIAALQRRSERAPEPHRARAQRFYASAAWRALRYRALAANAKRHGGVAECDLCHARAAPGRPLDADHIQPLSRDWSRRLDPTNVQILCRDCNFGKGNRDDFDFRSTRIDAINGQ